MTAKEKFEARVEELGLMEEWATAPAEWIGVETEKEIIVFVHFDDTDHFYSEYHYPRFDQMTREQVDALTANFANDDEKPKFLVDLAKWCAGNGSCPLFPCDVYPNIDPIEEIEFEDDEKIAEEREETEYQQTIVRNHFEIEHIKSNLKFYKARLEDMIRTELKRGHNLQEGFDPYPGWGATCFYGYCVDAGTKYTIKCDSDNELYISFPDGVGEEIKAFLTASDFPIEVLLHIYASMK